ncbi:MAG: Ycf66 family protein [Leptolyngbyaceae cyanobacterium]
MNFGTPVPLLIGIVLILGGVALFFLDKLKPGYGRDSDKIYAVLWLISGVFLLGHLNMELLASFQQMLMAGMLITLTIENVYTRTPREDRYASQNVGGPVGREEYYRPSRSQEYRGSSSRMNVRAEIDNDGPYRPRFPEDRRMIGGREEPARRSSGYYDDGYVDRYGTDQSGYPNRAVSPEDRSVERLNPSSDRLRRRRPRASDNRYDTSNANRSWDDSASGYAANTNYDPAGSDNYVGSGGYSSHTTSEGDRPSPRNNGDDSYVDYRPVNYPNDDSSQPSSDYGSRY